MAGGILDVSQHLMQAQHRGDVLTGLRTHTSSMGTPDSDRLLESYYRADPALPKPRVFFCGPAGLGSILARSCHRLGLPFRSERF